MLHCTSNWGSYQPAPGYPSPFHAAVTSEDLAAVEATLSGHSADFDLVN